MYVLGHVNDVLMEQIELLKSTLYDIGTMK